MDADNILFFIHKNTNNNIVVYELKGDNIDTYWLLDRKKRIELGVIEKRLAYGIKAHKDGCLSLCAFEKKFRIKNKRIVIKIHNTECYLTDVYSHIEGTFLRFPKVEYVIINGVSVDSGVKMTEKIVSEVK